MITTINPDWLEHLSDEFEKEYFIKLMDFVKLEYKTEIVYPPKEEIFSALQITPLSKVKVVILGQDPYHDEGQAHGLCFSVKPDIGIPKSLINIYKELQDDTGCSKPNDGYLIKWAQQGVLMLNTVLTVRAHAANSHQGKGWEILTDTIIEVINKQERPIVFILWGRHAIRKKIMLTNPKHLVLEAPHPSPLSAYRGFFGSKPFSKTNEFLVSNQVKPIDWSLD